MPEEKRGRGRPPVWSPELEQTILRHIENGATYKDACSLSGISIAPFYERKADYAEFAELVERASVRQKQAHIQNVSRCAFGIPIKNDEGQPIPGKWDVEPDGKLSLSYLQARYPEEYSRHRLEITGANGGPIKVSQIIEVMPLAIVEAEIAALLPLPEPTEEEKRSAIDTTTTDEPAPSSTTN